MSLPATKPALKPWVISPECQRQIEQLKQTSDWLRAPTNPDQFEPYRRKYIAARDCKIIADADTMEQLYDLLHAEPPGTYVIASFRGGRIRIVPHEIPPP